MDPVRQTEAHADQPPELKPWKFFVFHFLFGGAVLAGWSAYCLRDVQQTQHALLNQHLELMVDFVAGERPDRVESLFRQVSQGAHLEGFIVDANYKILLRTKKVPFAPQESVAHLNIWKQPQLAAPLALLPGQSEVRSSRRELSGPQKSTLVLYSDLPEVSLADIPAWPIRLLALGSVLLIFALGHWLAFYALVESKAKKSGQQPEAANADLGDESSHKAA